MILKDTEKDTEAASGSSFPGSADSPPAYSESSFSFYETSASPSSPTSSRGTATSSGPRPCNFVTVSRFHGALTGTYVVDPTMAIPQAMLPALADGEERENLHLETTHGLVDVDLSVASVPDYHGRVTMSVKTLSGPIKCRLHNVPGSPPLSLRAEAVNGMLTILLPRHFQGTVSASTWHGSITVSDGIAQSQTHFSEIQNTSKFFIGDISPLFAAPDEPWSGNEIIAETRHGRIKFLYEDEAEEAISPPPAAAQAPFGWPAGGIHTPLRHGWDIFRFGRPPILPGPFGFAPPRPMVHPPNLPRPPLFGFASSASGN